MLKYLLLRQLVYPHVIVNNKNKDDSQMTTADERTVPLASPSAPLPWQHKESVGTCVAESERKMEENNIRDAETGV